MITSMHIIASQSLGGAESFYLRLVRALHETGGHRVMGINRTGSAVGTQLAGEVPQEEVRMGGHLDLWSMWRIRRLIQQHRAEVVQTYMSRATDLTRLPGASHAVHIARLGGFYKLKYFRHADYWVGNTRGICDYLVSHGLPSNKVFFISNFVDEGRVVEEEERLVLRHSLSLPEDARIVLALGRFTRKKGFDVLLEALARAPAEVGQRPVHLVLLGDGDNAEALRRQADQLGLADRVHWTGWQTDPVPFFALADVFVCPSRHEPLGNVILEAWSHGVPVVSTATDGGQELIRPGVDGLLVPVEDAQAMAGTLRELLVDDRLRSSLAQEGRQALRQRHGKAAIVQAYDELYRHVLRS